MTNTITARYDEALAAHIVARTPMVYQDEVRSEFGRPAHVRAASSLAFFCEHLAIIQDDANFLAMVDPADHAARTVVLPESESGNRVFDWDAGTGHDKLDLEACVSVPGTGDGLLVALGSGSGNKREWIMLVDWRDNQPQPSISVNDADALFNALRANHEFCGGALNIEGAVFTDDDTLRVFQRGNAQPAENIEPVDATGDLSWLGVLAYLQDPSKTDPPVLRNVVRYGLGELRGTRLTFSDAEKYGQTILYSASAEAAGPQGEVVGSVFGVLDDDEARWTELIEEDGTAFGGKIEGLTLDPNNRHRAWFVVDDDTPDVPSALFEVELRGPWYSMV